MLINAAEHVVKLSLVSKVEKGVADVKREKTFKPVNMGPGAGTDCYTGIQCSNTNHCGIEIEHAQSCVAETGFQ